MIEAEFTAQGAHARQEIAHGFSKAYGPGEWCFCHSPEPVRGLAASSSSSSCPQAGPCLCLSYPPSDSSRLAGGAEAGGAEGGASILSSVSASFPRWRSLLLGSGEGRKDEKHNKAHGPDGLDSLVHDTAYK